MKKTSIRCKINVKSGHHDLDISSLPYSEADSLQDLPSSQLKENERKPQHSSQLGDLSSDD